MASNSRNLSHIQSLKDLQSEIVNIKAGLAAQEAHLKEYRKRMPAEARQFAMKKLVPATLTKIVPFLVTKGAVTNSWGFMRNALGLISVFRKQKKGGMTNKIVNTAKSVGVAAAVKGLFNFIKNRKHSSPQKIHIK